jgi:hypothetical protein
MTTCEITPLDPRLDQKGYYCNDKDKYKCKNMKETYSDMNKEKYTCSVCGNSYSLYYEDMT